MEQSASGIEVTANCPALMPQYKLDELELAIDGTVHSIEWDQPAFLAASQSGARTLDAGVEARHVAELAYSLSMPSLINPGKLELKGKRPPA